MKDFRDKINVNGIWHYNSVNAFSKCNGIRSIDITVASVFSVLI